jgi:adenosylhomocysteinase
MMERNEWVKQPESAAMGRDRIQWAGDHMPVLRLIQEDFRANQPLRGKTIGACLHVTTETANLMMTLKAGGARVFLCASNPLSTQDDVVASLWKDHQIPTYAYHGESEKDYYRAIDRVIAENPAVVMDDGADLISTLHKKGGKALARVLGGTEETSTGVLRLRNMAEHGVLRFPVIAVNDAYTKHLFDNRYGTGQSAMDGIIRATNLLIAGKVVLVAGYGWVGRGIAARARGLGARVIVSEVHPVRALEAAMDGFEVSSVAQAAPIADIIVTATGNRAVVRREHFLQLKDGAVLANAGHFDVEIDVAALRKMAPPPRVVRGVIEAFVLENKKTVYLLTGGRLVNLAAAEGHPPDVMDMSFANQALSVAYLVKKAKKLERRVYPVPEEIDLRIASLKLRAMGLKIDELTPEQEAYLKEWRLGT